MKLPGGGTLPFKTFLRRLYVAQDNHAAFDTAAQLGYYFVLSLFPLLFFLTALLAFLPLGNAQSLLLDRLRPLVPREVMLLLEEYLTGLLRTQRPKLVGFGMLFALWAASCAVDSARKALNLAYDVKESRPLWRTQLVAIIATVASSVFVLVAVSVLIAGGDAGHWIADHLGIGSAFTVGLKVARWPLTAGLMTLGIATSFYMLPDVKQRFTFMLPGATVGTLSWFGATWGFTQYVQHFGRYDVTYGSIGAVIVLLIWLYISGFLFVLGGEINAILEHASTEGNQEGARDEKDVPPPPAQRPSFVPPGAAGKATVAAARQPRSRLQKS